MLKYLALVLCVLFSFPTFAKLKIGLTNRAIELPVGVPLSGHGGKERMLSKPDWKNKLKYSFLFKPSEGYRDPIRVKAMVLENNGRKLLFMSYDFVAVTKRFRKKLYKRIKHLGFKKEDIFLTATHTHSGPGNVSVNPFWIFVTMDLYKKEIFNICLDAAVHAVAEADNNLTPATLHTLSFKDQVGMQVNRANRPGVFDPTVKFLLGKSTDGKWLGGLLNFAMHGIAMQSKIMLFSADIQGEIERRLETKMEAENSKLNLASQNDVTIVYVQAGEGDVNPVARREPLMIQHAEEFANQAMDNLSKAKEINGEWHSSRIKVKVGRPHMNISNCVKARQVKPKRPLLRKLMLAIKKFPLGAFFPKKVWLNQVQFDDLVMMAWPGELTTSMSYQLMDMAKENGFDRAWTLGLTNHHLSYFTTAWEYDRPEYEACANFYGREGGLNIVDGHRSLILNAKQL